MKFFGVKEVGPIWGEEHDPRYGYSNVATYHGDRALMLARGALAKAAGQRYRFRPDPEGATGTLEIIYGAEASQSPSEPLSDRWSLAAQMLEKSIFHSDWLLSWYDANDMTSQERMYFKLDCEAILRGEEIVADAGTTQRLAIASDWATKLDAVIKELARGTESFPVSQWVLRRTQVVALNYSLKPNLENVNKVFTTGTLRSTQNIPATIKFDLPDGYWLKQGPTVDQTAADKWTIVQEWWHSDEYSEFIYGASI